MKRIIGGLFALAALSANVVPAQAEVLKLATLIPTGSSWYGPIRDMTDEWRKASNGEVTVKIYPGGIAGDDPEVVRKMRVGQLQAATITTEGLRRILPDIMALHLPMMLRSTDELDFLRAQLGAELKRRIRDKGYVVLNWINAGWVRFFCKKPVVYPNDLKSLKIFTWSGDPVFVKAWRDGGFKPVPLPATNILGALQSGLIDCVPTVSIAALSYQWFGVAPHMTDLKWAPFTGATVISIRVWNKLPKATRERMLAIAEKTSTVLKNRVRALDRDSITAMQQYGLKVHEVPSDAMAAWDKTARSAYPAFTGSVVSREFLRKVENTRRRFNVEAGRN